MSALNWAMDYGQNLAIDTLEEKVEALEKDMATARAWIEHLTARIEVLERRAMIDNIKAGADVVDDFGGYSIGNQADHDAFVAKRNESLK
jgi:hypothetical protein